MPANASEKMRGLVYPWGAHAAPEPGTPVQVAEGVWWLRFPMPMALDHINLWLLEDRDGWTIVDTCLDHHRLGPGNRARHSPSPRKPSDAELMQ